MPCPHTRTDPVFTSGGNPGIILYGASSPRKRANHREGNDELLPKRAKPTSIYPTPRLKAQLNPNRVLPKIETPNLDVQDSEADPHQPILRIPTHLQLPETNLSIKCEADASATNPNNALAHTIGEGLFRPRDDPQDMNWAAVDDPHILSLFYENPDYLPSHTLSISSNNLVDIDSRTQRPYQDNLNTFSSSALWPTGLEDSHPSDWKFETTQLDGWFTAIQDSSSHCADYVPLYATSGPSIPYGHLESTQDLTLSEQPVIPHNPPMEVSETEIPYLQYHLNRHYSPQSLGKLQAAETTFPQPLTSISNPHESRTYLHSHGVHYEELGDASSRSPSQQWPAQGPPHNTTTEEQDRTFEVAPQETSSTAQWNPNMLPVATHFQQGLLQQEGSPAVSTVKSETYVEEGILVQPPSVQTPLAFDRTTFNFPGNFKHEKARPSVHSLSSHHQSLDTLPAWPIHPEHNPDLLSVCQLSRQTTHESTSGTSTTGKSATGTSDTNLKPRKPFGKEERQETSRTRDVGACIRCKMQRVRCRPNPANPDGPCIPCLKVASNPSKKVIHHIGCHRYKLQEITIFRTSPTPVNPKRWQTAQVRDVITYGESIFVKLRQQFGKSFVIRVSAFLPLENDETSRAGRDLVTGEEYNEPLGLFALQRAHDVIDDYRAYINENWYEEFANKFVKAGNPQDEAERLVAHVYKLSLCHMDHLPRGPSWDLYRSSADWDPKTVSERSFLQGTLMMCFVLRQALGQSWIDPEGLDPDLWPRHEKFSPLRGVPGTPRMIVSQLDCIRISCVLRPLAKPLLKVLTTWIAERRHDCWLSIFYASFIFLREIALATHDAYDHGKRKRNYNPKDPKPNHHSIIAEMHESANVILAHWHYFNCSMNVESLDEAARGKSPLRQLTLEQFQAVRGLWFRMRLWKAGRPQCTDAEESRQNLFKNDTGFKWCHPLYFAAQMFEPSWSPLEVFTG